MNEINTKKHWEKVYETKNPNEVSWTQAYPKTSINLINSFKQQKSASIIDIGGGDSLLVDFLLKEGYNNITVLDISKKAIDRAKKRLGKKANEVKWIVKDITNFEPESNYDIWHDRAAFHFLNTEKDIKKYAAIAGKTVLKNLVIGTFSNDGPLKCSGIEIVQYNERSMKNVFKNDFEKINSFKEDHTTPFNTIQNFIFCSFNKKL
ncbi:MAG: SAM-dependent methyltransferase [Crocinitomicaceae bacterium]|nr:SAM-dependent methyltransferase [Crocinitomicaceae bacterium]|tara:strand:- start:3042 stop:3659 length:618 start_codon:yes stop_codon:yes gene_type:complete